LFFSQPSSNLVRDHAESPTMEPPCLPLSPTSPGRFFPNPHSVPLPSCQMKVKRRLAHLSPLLGANCPAFLNSFVVYFSLFFVPPGPRLPLANYLLFPYRHCFLSTILTPFHSQCSSRNAFERSRHERLFLFFFTNPPPLTWMGYIFHSSLLRASKIMISGQRMSVHGPPPFFFLERGAFMLFPVSSGDCPCVFFVSSSLLLRGLSVPFYFLFLVVTRGIQITILPLSDP